LNPYLADSIPEAPAPKIKGPAAVELTITHTLQGIVLPNQNSPVPKHANTRGKISLGLPHKLKTAATKTIPKTTTNQPVTQCTCSFTPAPVRQSAAGMVINVTGHNKTASETSNSENIVSRSRHPADFHDIFLRQ
jgi:hypothetical protein